MQGLAHADCQATLLFSVVKNDKNIESSFRLLSHPNMAYMSVSWAGTPCTLSGALVPSRNFARCKIHFASKPGVLPYYTSGSWRPFRNLLQGLLF